MQPQSNRAGTVYGPSHKAGGVKFVLDTGHLIEEEGKEVNIPQELLSSKTVYTFRGSNKNILHRILKLAGLSAFDKVTDVRYGDVIICMRSAEDKASRILSGTIVEILDQVNQSKGCRPIIMADGRGQKADGNTKYIAKNGMRIPLKQRIKDWQIENPNSPRWQKKKERAMVLSNTTQRLRMNVSKDIQSDDEKTALTALAIAVMLNTGYYHDGGIAGTKNKTNFVPMKNKNKNPRETFSHEEGGIAGQTTKNYYLPTKNRDKLKEELEYEVNNLKILLAS